MKIVAICACPSGVAHTYLAAAALKDAAKKFDFDIKVETQGSIGIENEISQIEADEANCVILTKDVSLKNTARFKNKKVYSVKASDAIKKADVLMKKIQEEC